MTAYLTQQGQNLLPYSEQFDNAAWSKSNTTVSANATTAPDEATTADKLVEDTASAVHYISQSATLSSGVVYTRSIYAKAAERTRLELQADAGSFGGTEQRVQFNLSTGAVTTAVGTAVGRLVDVGGGWYRCIVTYPATSASGGNGFQNRLLDASGNTTYTGDGTSGMFLWGASVVVGSAAGPYTRTTASAVTASLNYLEVLPEWETENAVHSIESRARTSTGRLDRYRWATYQRTRLPLRYVRGPAARDFINVQWTNQATVTYQQHAPWREITGIISNPERPLPTTRERPYNGEFVHGTVEIETL